MARGLAERSSTGVGDSRASLFGDWSVEATLPKPGDIEALTQEAPAGTEVYLSALAKNHGPGMVADAVAVREAGFEPVPHVAVRNFESVAELERFLSELRAQADVRTILAIAGDRDRPNGPITSSTALIASGMLENCGIERVGVSGYPEGHPRIDDDALAAAFEAKLEAAAKAGLELFVVTQFCFDAAAVGRFIARLRAGHPQIPIRIGLAGPAGRATLMKFALRCGVRASARGLTRNFGQLAGLVGGGRTGETTPDSLIEALAAIPQMANEHAAALHFFSFGGLGRTARWASERAARETMADRSEDPMDA